ncbi:MAG: glycosyltransferase family 4 protein [Holosporaceae bacterium]|jgi:glycosyltransferase involved in cell wall biosynthesis|nr:glycosyltransferase family 4 protein [Holosporaceae bacterium]
MSSTNSPTTSDYEKTILVDVNEICSGGGIYTVASNLIQEISQKRPKWKFILMHRKEYNYLWKSIKNGKNIDALYIIDNYASVASFVVLNMPIIDDIVTNITDLLPDKIKRFLGKIKCFLRYSIMLPNVDLFFDPVTTTSFNNFYLPRVTVIHDLLYNDLPKRMYSPKYAQMSAEMAARYSNAIITISKFSQRKIWELLDIDEKKVHLVYTALAKRLNRTSIVNHEEVLKKYGLTKNKYIVYPSYFWLHKNHDRLIEAFMKYRRQYKSDMKLVLMGSVSEIEDEKHHLRNCADRLVFTNRVDDNTFRVIMEDASAVIQASLYEGFGMTVLEGMNAGKPVTASRVAAIPEIAEDAVLYFDPYDVDDICSAIHRITSDENLRCDLIKKGWKQVKKFSNKEKMIEEYIKIMESVMQ